MRRGEVWWAEPESLNGSEIQKTRLVVIISNDSSKRKLFRAAVVPITSGIERIYPGEVLIRILGKKGNVMVDQIKTAGKKQLRTKIGALSKTDLLVVEDVICVHLDLPR